MTSTLSSKADAPPPGVLESLRRLIASLREELQQYGEFLALLDRQHDLAGVWASDELLQSIGAVYRQAAVLERARAARDRFHSDLATALGQSSAVSFAVLIPLLPVDYQPLVEALVLENNQLLLQVQQRAHQNQVSMSRSVARMQQFLRELPTLRESDIAPVRRASPRASRSLSPTPQLEVVG